MLFADNIFTFLRGGIRVLLDQVIRVAEHDLLGEAGLDVVLGTDDLVSVIDGLVNVLDSRLESFDIAICWGDDLFPVPLVDVPGWKTANVRR